MLAHIFFPVKICSLQLNISTLHLIDSLPIQQSATTLCAATEKDLLWTLTTLFSLTFKKLRYRNRNRSFPEDVYHVPWR